MWKWPVIAAIVVAAAVVGAAMFSAKRHAPMPIAAMPPSAPGSLRPGEKVSPHFISSIEKIAPDKDGLNRRITATFKIETKKLPKGTYTVSARVEADEEGKKLVQESSNLYSYVATRVTNSYTLTVP